MQQVDALPTPQTIALPPLRLEVVGKTARGLIVRAEWQGRSHEFVARVKRALTPRQLRVALQDFATTDRLPMLIAPYLSPESLEILASAQVSGIDLSGNGLVVVPGEWLIHRSGEKNRFPASTAIRSVYRGTSSLVARVFMCRPEFARFTDVLAEIRGRGGSITAPTVSKVLRQLEEDLVVERSPEGFRVLDPARLLSRLAAHYQPRVTGRVRGTFRDPEDKPAKLWARADAAGTKLVLRDEQEYVNAPSGDDVMTYYTDSISRAVESSSFVEEPRYGDVAFEETPRQEVFFDARMRSGWRLCSPLQIYLELTGGGKREREIAETLRPDLLAYRFG
jgi:hypothetical protein